MERRQAEGAPVSTPRFLIVRFSAIGDCVMALPAATAIRERHPDAMLVWAVDRRCATVVDTERLVTELAEFPRDQWKAGRWSARTWRDQIHHYTRLRAYKFDFGIDFQGHSKTALCLRLAAPRQAVSVPNTDVFASRLNPRTRAPLKGLHTVERNLAILNELGDFPTPAAAILPDISTERAFVAPQLPDSPFASICTGGGSPDKRYPVEQWASVARTLVAAGVPVVWVGAPTDPVPEVEGTHDLVGKLSWRQTMAVLHASAVHVASDTGTGHLAAALGVPCATVFGPMDPALYRPYIPEGRVLRSPDGDPSAILPDDLAAAALELVNLRAPTVSP